MPLKNCRVQNRLRFCSNKKTVGFFFGFSYITNSDVNAEWKSGKRFWREQRTERPHSFSIWFSSAAKEFATIWHANANWSPKQTTFQTPWNCFLKTTKLPLISASPICFSLCGLNCLNLSRKAGEHAGCVNRAAVACFLLIDLLGYLGFCLLPGADGQHLLGEGKGAGHQIELWQHRVLSSVPFLTQNKPRGAADEQQSSLTTSARKKQENKKQKTWYVSPWLLVGFSKRLFHRLFHLPRNLCPVLFFLWAPVLGYGDLSEPLAQALVPGLCWTK